MKTLLQLNTALKNGRTILAKSYTNPPFKVANITEDKQRGDLRIMLMSSSPGILDGDNYELNFVVEDGCCLSVSTQSYQRLFQMKESASQTTVVHVKKNASFTYIPHPTVPHKNAFFKAVNNIYLADSSSLVWGEIITSGRGLDGESFLFSKLHFQTNIFCSNKLIIKENMVVEPGLNNVQALGLWENFTHQASLIVCLPNAGHSQVTDYIHQHLTGQPNISFGVTLAQNNTIVVRILGNKAEQLYNLLQHFSSYLHRHQKLPVHGG